MPSKEGHTNLAAIVSAMIPTMKKYPTALSMNQAAVVSAWITPPAALALDVPPAAAVAVVGGIDYLLGFKLRMKLTRSPTSLFDNP